MSRFARVGENAVAQNLQISGEELRLFVIIVFHSWIPPHVCEFKLSELCEIYGLNYDHSCARFKELRRKGWCDKVGKYPRPIVGMPNEKTSKSEVNENAKTSKSEVFKGKKLQNRKLKTSKSEVIDPEKLQNRKFFDAHIRNIDLKQDLLESSTKIVDTTTDETNGHKSQFSREEIIRYLDIRTSRGERIETPHKLAQWMYQTGDYDAFIKATLYPEPIEQTIEYDDGEAPIGDDVPQWLPESVLSAHLYEFKLMSDDEFVEYQKHYTEDNWSWLVEHRK